MRGYRNKRQVQHLFPEYKIIKNEEEKNIQYGIAPAASCITESQPVHKPAEWPVKKIQNIFNPCYQNLRLNNSFFISENR